MSPGGKVTRGEALRTTPAKALGVVGPEAQAQLPVIALIWTRERPTFHSTADSEVALKAVGAAITILVALYFADQLFAQGKYTDAAQRMAMQMRHSTGI